MLNFSYFSYSQTPAVRIHTNEIDHPSNQKDWLFDVFEDSEFNLVHSGYSGVTGLTYPSLIKTDGYLNSIWTKRFTSGNDNTGIEDFYGYGSLQAAIEYTDPNDNLPYIVAVGYASLKGNVRLVIVKTKPDGTLVSTFPRIYRNALGYNDTAFGGSRRGRDIIYRPFGESGFFYIAGLENQKPCVFRLNEDLSWSSLTKYEPTSPQNFGDLYGLCFEYPIGTLPDGKPKIITPGIGQDIPTNIWAIGMAYDTLNKKGYDSNIIITRIPIDSTSPDQTVIETSLAPPSPVWNNTGGSGYGPKPPIPAVHTTWYNHFKNQAPLCGSKFHNRTSGDMGMSIQQLADGNMVTASMCNIIMWTNYYGTSYAPCISTFNGSHTFQTSNATIPYWTDADKAATIIERANFPTPGLPANGGYEKEAKHLGHISGYESFIKVRQDYDGKLYFTSSNGDTLVAPINSYGRTNYSSFLVIKTEPNLTEIWNKAYAGNDDDQVTCGFGSVVCQNNELVVNGDNKNASDNYDIIRLSNDCEETCTTYTQEPTTPNSFDFVTISTLDLLGGNPGTLTFTTDEQFKGRLVIESGCTVVVDDATLEFANMEHLVDKAIENGFEYGIEVEPGGKLILQNNAVLTSLEHCHSYWRGVHLKVGGSPSQQDPSTIGILEMFDSRIENAVCGVTVEGGALITCTNNDNVAPEYLNHINFKNNRKGVAFMPFAGDNLSRFNFTNFSFEDPAAINDFFGIGLNTHCSMFGVDKIIFNGCTFKNRYTGPYRVGLGLASFDATFQVLKGNNTSTGCYPTGKTAIFENLVYGMYTNRTTGSANFIGVGEADFTNCYTAWQCDNDAAPLSYLNTYEWNNDLDDYPMPDNNKCYGLVFNNTDDIKIHENTFTTSGSYPDGHGIIINQTVSTPHTSIIKNNTFTENSGGSIFNYGLNTTGDNSLLELKCNEFIDMRYYDWYNNGDMQDQGDGSSADFANEFTATIGTANIHSASGTFQYFDYSGFAPAPPTVVTGSASNNTTTVFPPIDCSDLDKCDVYNDGIMGGTFEFEDVAMMIQQPKEIIWDNIKAKNYKEAIALSNAYPKSDYKKFLQIIIPILQSGRETKPSIQEVNMIKEIANTQNEASVDARHFLSFFLEILIVPKYDNPSASVNRTASNNPVTSSKSDKIKFKAYPNPTSNSIHFDWDLKTDEPISLSITDINGRLVTEIKNLEAKSNTMVDLKQQANGVYIYKIYNGKGYFKTGKFVLSK